MFDFRQHVASLVAVFLALGLGVVFGATLAGEGGLTRRQAELVQRLERDYAVLRAENRSHAAAAGSWQRLAGQYREYAAAAFPLVVQDKLKGVQVAVLATGAFPDPAALVKALQQAGAEVASLTLTGDWEQRSEDWLKSLPLPPADRPHLGSLASRLGAEVAGAEPGVVTALAEQGLIALSGQAAQPRAAVILGGSASREGRRARDFDLPLARALLKSGVLVVAAEAGTAPFSDADQYRRLGIPVIAAADTVCGQTDLIRALAQQLSPGR